MSLFFGFLGVNGSGGVFNRRRNTSSSRLDFGSNFLGFVMPQPLRTLVKPGLHLSLKDQLTEADPALCILAMNIVAQWATVERDFATFIISIAPGKAGSIAELLNAARADSRKKAIRNTLAMSHLAKDELPLFEAIQLRYESCFKLRNPLVHWTLCTCKQLPDIIAAVNPEDYIRVTASGESEIDLMVREMASEENPSLSGPARLSDNTVKRMMPTYQKYLDVAVAYRKNDLIGIFDQITRLLNAVREFRMIVRFRCLDLASDKRAGLLRQLYAELGLSPPTAG